jgi:flagellar protein FlgJ
MTNITGTENSIQERPPVVSTSKGNKEANLKKVCGEFEAIFVQYMLKSARKASAQEGLFDNTHESKLYKSMMDEQLAHSATRGRGMGLGELLYRELIAKSKASSEVSDYV